jgi:UDP-glucose 4-epimerase
MMLEGKQPTIFGDGEQARDFVYVGDVVRANLLAMNAGAGETVNIGTGVLLTVNELYRKLQTLTGYESPPTYAPARPGEVYRMVLDAHLAERVLGWRPVTPIDEGLRATVAWLAAGRTA